MQRRCSVASIRWLAIVSMTVCLLAAGHLSAQSSSTSSSSSADLWQVPISHNPMPHFEEASGRKILYVDGQPFTVLAVEIPWWDLIYGRYKETETAYDNLYPAAAKLRVNALKVPI